MICPWCLKALILERSKVRTGYHIDCARKLTKLEDALHDALNRCPTPMTGALISAAIGALDQEMKYRAGSR